MQGRKTKIKKGDRFDLLTVIKEVEKSGKERRFLCKCDCGEERIIFLNNLHSNASHSCGCYGRNKRRKHYLRGTRLYTIWKNIKTRCYNKNSKAYNGYGGRGIKVCDIWQHSPQAFYDWSLKNGYKQGLQIDRKDNNGDYSPENCRWTTPVVQSNNRRDNVRVLFKGKLMTVAEVCRSIDMLDKTWLIHQRVRRNGWDIVSAFKGFPLSQNDLEPPNLTKDEK